MLALSYDRLLEVAGTEHADAVRLNADLQKARASFARLRVLWIVKSYNLAQTSESFVEWIVQQDLRVGVVNVIKGTKYKHLLVAARELTPSGQTIDGWMCHFLTIALNEELAVHGIDGRLEAYRDKGMKRVQFRYTPAP